MYEQKNIQEQKKTNKKTILILLIIIFLIFLFSSRTPKLTINGDEIVTVPLNENYVDKGATAIFGARNISNKIQTNMGNINTKKPGTYTITYTVKKNRKTQTATRTVKVVDNISPVLKLNGNSEITIAEGSKYQEFGCTASDNYDGNLTTKISINQNVDTKQVGTYTVNYSVKDSSNNQAQVTRTVNVVKKGTKGISTEKPAGLPVLMYHFFYDKNSPPEKLDANFMEIHDFEEQIKYLSDNNYYFPTWDEVTNYVKGTSCLPENSVVLTADDGNETFFNLAVPVIEKYNVKITSFLITSWMGNKDDLKKYDQNKIIFESHSHDMHRAGSNGKGRMLTMSYDEICADLKQSQDFIGNATVFCYPFGNYNESCYKPLQDTGFKLAFTTKNGRIRPGDDCYALTRIRMSKGESIKSFESKVSNNSIKSENK